MGTCRVGAGEVVGGVSGVPTPADPWEDTEGLVPCEDTEEPELAGTVPDELVGVEDEEPEALVGVLERPGISWATTPTITPTAVKAPAVAHAKTRLTRLNAELRGS